MGRGYGTAGFDTKFRGYNTLFFLFMVEAVGLSVLFGYVELSFTNILYQYAPFVPAIVSESLALFSIWFSQTFKYKVRWKMVGLLQLVCASGYV
jgi:hypothetical protein